MRSSVFHLINSLFVLALAYFVAVPQEVQAQEKTDSEEKSLEIVQPRSYAIKRFSEIVTDHQNNQPDKLSDRLIRARALLNISRREKSNYIQKQSELGNEPKADRIKSMTAMIDHFEKRVRSLEKRIKKK